MSSQYCNIPIPLPFIYVPEDWDYKKTNIGNIKKAISNFDWNDVFENLSIDEKVELLNETLLNIFRITFQITKLIVTIGNLHG